MFEFVQIKYYRLRCVAGRAFGVALATAGESSLQFKYIIIIVNLYGCVLIILLGRQFHVHTHSQVEHIPSNVMGKILKLPRPGFRITFIAFALFFNACKSLRCDGELISRFMAFNLCVTAQCAIVIGSPLNRPHGPIPTDAAQLQARLPHSERNLGVGVRVCGRGKINGLLMTLLPLT